MFLYSFGFGGPHKNMVINESDDSVQVSRCGSRWLMNRDWPPSSLCGALSGLAVLFYPNSSVAMYVFWKFIEVCFCLQSWDAQVNIFKKEVITRLFSCFSHLCNPVDGSFGNTGISRWDICQRVCYSAHMMTLVHPTTASSIFLWSLKILLWWSWWNVIFGVVWMNKGAYQAFYIAYCKRFAVPYGDILLYGLSTGYVAWNATIEPQTLREGYWKFLVGLTGKRLVGFTNVQQCCSLPANKKTKIHWVLQWIRQPGILALTHGWNLSRWNRNFRNVKGPSDSLLNIEIRRQCSSIYNGFLTHDWITISSLDIFRIELLNRRLFDPFGYCSSGKFPNFSPALDPSFVTFNESWSLIKKDWAFVDFFSLLNLPCVVWSCVILCTSFFAFFVYKDLGGLLVLLAPVDVNLIWRIGLQKDQSSCIHSSLARLMSAYVLKSAGYCSADITMRKGNHIEKIRSNSEK